MTKYFQPPVVYDLPGVPEYDPVQPVTRDQRRLFRYFSGRARGRTVLKINGTYATYDSPTTDQVASATEVYMGGHWYDIDDTIGAALTAAGYTVFDTRPNGSVHGVVTVP